MVDVADVDRRKDNIFQRRHRRVDCGHRRGLRELLDVPDDDIDGDAADDDQKDDPDGPPDIAHVAI